MGHDSYVCPDKKKQDNKGATNATIEELGGTVGPPSHVNIAKHKKL